MLQAWPVINKAKRVPCWLQEDQNPESKSSQRKKYRVECLPLYSLYEIFQEQMSMSQDLKIRHIQWVSGLSNTCTHTACAQQKKKQNRPIEWWSSWGCLCIWWSCCWSSAKSLGCCGNWREGCVLMLYMLLSHVCITSQTREICDFHHGESHYITLITIIGVISWFCLSDGL